MSLLFALSSSLAGGQHEQQWYRAQLCVALQLSRLTSCRCDPELFLLPPLLASPAHKGAVLALLGSQGVQSPGSWGRVISLPICWRLDKLSHSLRLHSREPGAAQQACYMQIRQKSHLIVHEIKTDPQVGQAAEPALLGLCCCILLPMQFPQSPAPQSLLWCDSVIFSGG